jgi:hypothetical protein
MATKNTAPAQTNEDLKSAVAALTNTSAKIRFLSKKGKSTADIYRLLKEFGITTRTGGEIKYQHVRNVLMTKLSGETSKD